MATMWLMWGPMVSRLLIIQTMLNQLPWLCELGSGVGANVAVNKVPGIRGSVCHDTYSAHQGVEHDDMNVLVLGARIVGPALARELVDAFLHAQFSGDDRHNRRLDKVRRLESKNWSG